MVGFVWNILWGYLCVLHTIWGLLKESIEYNLIAVCVIATKLVVSDLLRATIAVWVVAAGLVDAFWMLSRNLRYPILLCQIKIFTVAVIAVAIGACLEW